MQSKERRQVPMLLLHLEAEFAKAHIRCTANECLVRLTLV